MNSLYDAARSSFSDATETLRRVLFQPTAEQALKNDEQMFEVVIEQRRVTRLYYIATSAGFVCADLTEVKSFTFSHNIRSAKPFTTFKLADRFFSMNCRRHCDEYYAILSTGS